MSVSSPQPKRRRSRGCLVALLLLLMLLLLVVAGGAWWMLSLPKAVALGPAVNIRSPQTGDLAGLGAPVQVLASAELDAGVNSLELYADGSLVARQDTTLPEGSNPLVLAQSYVAPNAGRHVLMARAYTSDGAYTDSEVVYVDVIESPPGPTVIDVDSIPRGEGAPNPSLNDISTGVGVPPGRLIELNPGLSGADPAAPLLPGTRLTLPPPSPGGTSGSGGTSGGGAPPPAPRPGAPAAPTDLNAVADCASIQLAWVDSPDEAQYVVYRLGPGETRLNRIATLPAGTVLYSDAPTRLGEYRYEIASVRAGLEALSAMQTARTPDLCLPPELPPGATDLQLRFISIETRAAYEGVYCYFSINDNPYERVPVSPASLLTPDRDNPQRFSLAQLPNRGRFSLSRHLESEPVTFAAECVGRNGITVESLGSVSVNHPNTDWDGSEREAWFRSPIELAALPTVSDAFIIAPAFRVRYTLGAAASASSITPGLLYTPPIVWPDYSLSAPTNLRGDSMVLRRCDLNPLCPPYGSPILRWDWNGGPFFDEFSIDGYHVTLTATDPSLPGSPTVIIREWDVRPGSQKWVQTPDTYPCGSTLQLSVTAVSGSLRSRPAATRPWIHMACPERIQATVTFQQILIGSDAAFGEMRDVNGDFCFLCVDRRLELVGSFAAAPGPAILETSDTGGGIFAPCLRDAFCLTPGTYPFRDLNARLVDVHYAGQDNSSNPRSQWLISGLRRGQTVTISYGLNEIDYGNTASTASGCTARLELRPNWPQNWNSIDGVYDMAGGGGEEGACVVRVSVTTQALP